MLITYVEPEAESWSPEHEYALGVDLAERPLRVALVANTFPDVRPFVDHLEGELRALLPGAEFTIWQKPNVESVVPAVLDDILANADVLVTAIGH